MLVNAALSRNKKVPPRTRSTSQARRDCIFNCTALLHLYGWIDGLCSTLLRIFHTGVSRHGISTGLAPAPSAVVRRSPVRRRFSIGPTNSTYTLSTARLPRAASIAPALELVVGVRGSVLDRLPHFLDLRHRLRASVMLDRCVQRLTFPVLLRGGGFRDRPPRDCDRSRSVVRGSLLRPSPTTCGCVWGLYGALGVALGPSSTCAELGLQSGFCLLTNSTVLVAR